MVQVVSRVETDGNVESKWREPAPSFDLLLPMWCCLNGHPPARLVFNHATLQTHGSVVARAIRGGRWQPDLAAGSR